MKKSFILDACGLIAFLADEDGANRVEQLLLEAKEGTSEIFMHTLNLLEIYYGVFGEDGLEKAELVLKRIADFPINVINKLEDEVFKVAGRLKATYKIFLADSIVLAEALVRDALVVTSDHHEFDTFEGKEPISFFWIR